MNAFDNSQQLYTIQTKNYRIVNIIERMNAIEFRCKQLMYLFEDIKESRHLEHLKYNVLNP